MYQRYRNYSHDDVKDKAPGLLAKTEPIQSPMTSGSLLFTTTVVSFLDLLLASGDSSDRGGLHLCGLAAHQRALLGSVLFFEDGWKQWQ